MAWGMNLWAADEDNQFHWDALDALIAALQVAGIPHTITPEPDGAESDWSITFDPDWCAAQRLAWESRPWATS